MLRKSVQAKGLRFFNQKISRVGVPLALTQHRSFSCPVTALSCPVTCCSQCLTNCPFVTNLTAHFTQCTGCTTLGGLLYSPLGTAMLILLAYNVIVIVSKQFHYAHELTAKDYVQDLNLYTIMNYGIMICILLGLEMLFIEV